MCTVSRQITSPDVFWEGMAVRDNLMKISAWNIFLILKFYLFLLAWSISVANKKGAKNSNGLKLWKNYLCSTLFCFSVPKKYTCVYEYMNFKINCISWQNHQNYFFTNVLIVLNVMVFLWYKLGGFFSLQCIGVFKLQFGLCKLQ